MSGHHPWPPQSKRPATRIGRTVIFPGGAVRRLSLWEWPLFALGLRKSLSTRTN